ncbi:MAG: hypothetical protein HC897_13310 [Thermoanaerobaculia bacterium]|nr:hypothetical protein [Thermoanaerobaculia bacterium]
MKLYIPFNVLKRLPGNATVCYRCFRVIPDNKYCVQSADFYYEPFESEKIAESDRQFHELFREQAPDERSVLADSIEEAIALHDQEFELAVDADDLDSA